MISPLICALAALAGALTFASLLAFSRAVPVPNRAYMDPLSTRMRILWPLVLFFAHYFGRLCSVEYLERVQRQLIRAGRGYHISAAHFVALRMVSALLAAVITWSAIVPFDRSAPMWSLVALVFGYAIPQLNLEEARRCRERAIMKTLPTYLDFITMAVEAGLSLSGALVQASANGPKGLFSQELERVNRDITAGAGRIEALEAMSARLEIRHVHSVVSAIAQADRSGGSIGGTLRIQAEQQRVDRFQRAEKLAMEAPVKLIFPLVAFIFPSTFIVLGFPIAMKMLHQI